MDGAILRELNALRRARRAAIVVKHTATGATRLVADTDNLSGDPIGDELSDRFLSGKSGMARSDGAEDLFLTVYLPPPRLIVIGAVHISQALAPMARLAGFDVSIIDPRTAFATPERFPDTDLRAEWPEDALKEHPLDRYTALAALTHDPKIDDYPLETALRAECFYVGALGSRKTQARRRERLFATGLDEAALSRIHGPIGLDIRAQSPSEIAVAILAQVIGELRGSPLTTKTS